MIKRLLPLLLALPLPAIASSPAAWAAMDAGVARRCNAASGLMQPRTGQVVGFDDTLGKVVALVTGRQRLADGRVVTIRKLCVHDARSHRVWLSEANGWRSPDR